MANEGLLGNVRGIASDGVRMVRTRLELLVIELQEEKAKVVQQLIVASATLFFLSFGTLLSILWLVVSLPEDQRKMALGGLGLLFLVAGAAGAAWLSRKRERMPLDSTLDVLKRDELALRPTPATAAGARGTAD